MSQERVSGAGSGAGQVEPLAKRSAAGLGLRRSERRLLLRVVDLLLMLLALLLALKLRSAWLDSPGAVFALWRWWVTLGVVWLVTAHVLNAYDLALAASAPHSILRTVPAALLAVLIYQFIPVYSPPLASRQVIFVFAAFAAVLIAVWRGVYALVFVQPAFRERALVLGAGFAGQALAGALLSGGSRSTPNPYRGTGYEIIGFVDDDPAKRAAGYAAGLPVLGSSGDLLRLARELAVDEVVLAITHRHTMTQEAFDALLACREQGFNVTTMPALYERLLGRVPVAHVGRSVSEVLPVTEGSPTERLFWAAKRAMDLILAVLGLLPLALLIPIVALANRVSSRGPLFYRQTRLGKGGRVFSVVKFRTMRPNAEDQTGAVWSEDADPRVTRTGRWLRRSRLDELPQIVNVLRGEMSMIGPRPERPEFVEALAREIPFYRARHAVPPGITGWAQVRFGYGNSMADALTKLEYDLYYARHAGFYLDALIVLKTIAVMLGLKGK